MIPEPVYTLEKNLSVVEMIDLLTRSTLAARRPVDQPDIIAGMIRNADILITARIDGLLVGLSRAITDYSYCTYLSDLAVDQKYQKQGIGKQLISLTHESAGLHTRLILLSAPAAVMYYPHIGMEKHDSCWMIAPVKKK